jgi:hypothetical protein
MYAAVHLEKPTVLHLFNKYPTVHQIKRFSSVQESWPLCPYFAPSHLLNSHCNIPPHICHPSGLFPSGLPNFLLTPLHATCPGDPKIKFGKQCDSEATHITTHMVITNHHQKNLKPCKLIVNEKLCWGVKCHCQAFCYMARCTGYCCSMTVCCILVMTSLVPWIWTAFCDKTSLVLWIWTAFCDKTSLSFIFIYVYTNLIQELCCLNDTISPFQTILKMK